MLWIYLTGIVLSNSRIVFRRGIPYFHDALAWLGQIPLFIMRLLSYPSNAELYTGKVHQGTA